MITTRVLGSGVIGGQVFYDSDGDGMRDANTHINGVADVNVWLFSCSPFKPLAYQTTASNGIYRFRDLSRGSYSIIAQPPTGYQFSASGIIDDTSSGNLLDSTIGTIDLESGEGTCYELKEGEKTMGWNFATWRPSSDGPSLQPSTLPTHSNGPTLELSNDPATTISSLNPTLNYSQLGTSEILSPTATSNPVTTIDSPTVTVTVPTAPGSLSNSISTNSPATTSNLNLVSNHSLDPLQFSSPSIMPNPVTTIDSPSPTVTTNAPTVSNNSGLSKTEPPSYSPSLEPSTGTIGNNVLSQTLFPTTTTANAPTVSNYSGPSKTEPPNYSPSPEPSTGTIGNNVLSQTLFPTTSAPEWDSLSFIYDTKIDKNNIRDNNATGIIGVAYLLVALALCLVFMEVLGKRKIMRCFVKGGNLGTEALPTNLSRERSGQEDGGSDSISDGNLEVVPLYPPPILSMTVQDSSKGNDQPRSNSDCISESNKWNHDAIDPNASRLRSLYGLVPKTENNVRSLENLHRAFSIAIRSYPKNSSQWLRLNLHMEQVREELDAISSQDIEVHDPNTAQVDMAPPSENGLFEDDEPSDGGQLYIRILHPTLSTTNDDILAVTGENILAVDGEDVRQLSPEEVDTLQCRITMRGVQKIWTVKDENNMFVGYGDGSNRANDQLPLMLRGAEWA